MYDIDGNGTIDKGEFQIIIESIFKILDKKNKYKKEQIEEKSNELFKIIDTDCSNSITLSEFTLALTKDKQLLDLLAPTLKSH